MPTRHRHATWHGVARAGSASESHRSVTLREVVRDIRRGLARSRGIVYHAWAPSGSAPSNYATAAVSESGPRSYATRGQLEPSDSIQRRSPHREAGAEDSQPPQDGARERRPERVAASPRSGRRPAKHGAG